MNTNVLSFSGGKDSTAMVLEMLERNEPVHSIVYVDTGFQFPTLWETMKQLDAHCVNSFRIDYSLDALEKGFNHA